ncbi:hypothetical protein DIPPA_05719 [Diplonema papillatum]|nr:hypothetical protein DIPPA_05719 [Diplonema papillatum]
MYNDRVERRSDPTQPGGPRYSQAEFVSYYGEGHGTSLWLKAAGGHSQGYGQGYGQGGGHHGQGGYQGGGYGQGYVHHNYGAAPVYYVGMKVRALTKLTGEKDQVVMKGDIGEVTAVPGPRSAIADPAAVAEVFISRVRFDAHADMIEPATREYRGGEGRVDRRGNEGNWGNRYEQRSDPRGYQRNDRPAGGKGGKGGGKGGKGGKFGGEREEERRRDPADPKSRKSYTRREFIEHYGKEKGMATWKAAGGKVEKRADPSEKDSRKTYEKREFIELYGAKKGVQLWNQAGESTNEKRADPSEPSSRKKYTKQEFIELYGAKKGASVWDSAERRPDPKEANGKTYTKQEFVELYGKEEGARIWSKAGGAAGKASKGGKAEKAAPAPVEKKFKYTIEKAEDEKIGWSRDDAHIIEVEDDSPAHKAGVKVNSRIVSVNGEAATDKNLAALIKKAGNKLEIEVVALRQDMKDPSKGFFSYVEFCKFYKADGASAWSKAAGPRKEKSARKPKDKAEGDDKEDKKPEGSAEPAADKPAETKPEEAKKEANKEAKTEAKPEAKAEEKKAEN